MHAQKSMDIYILVEYITKDYNTNTKKMMLRNKNDPFDCSYDISNITFVLICPTYCIIA